MMHASCRENDGTKCKEMIAFFLRRIHSKCHTKTKEYCAYAYVASRVVLKFIISACVLFCLHFSPCLSAMTYCSSFSYSLLCSFSLFSIACLSPSSLLIVLPLSVWFQLVVWLRSWMHEGNFYSASALMLLFGKI